ncbi:TadE/TadG family type IV pilus assembly protein [Novosphingobium umbonatum]|uniref:TadE/TadG family type IV pilus assembly protein n=1 Tax=Novosphingobium umbonatum TaxID=1908524 RepID=UPI0013E379EC|nr:TadE/TadG family type IV pilus assembly protein [Novosphingobium umbonatum]
MRGLLIGRKGKVALAKPRLALLRALLASKSGATLVEFALVAPAFFALIVAIFQTAFLFLAEQGLQTSADAAARLLLTGQTTTNAYTAAQFKTAACTTLPPFLSCSRLYIDVSTASSFSAATLGAPTITYDSSGNVTNSFNYTTGSSGQIIVLRMIYLWPTLTGPLGFSLVTTGKNQHLVLATAVIKAERY